MFIVPVNIRLQFEKKAYVLILHNMADMNHPLTSKNSNLQTLTLSLTYDIRLSISYNIFRTSEDNSSKAGTNFR